MEDEICAYMLHFEKVSEAEIKLVVEVQNNFNAELSEAIEPIIVNLRKNSETANQPDGVEVSEKNSTIYSRVYTIDKRPTQDVKADHKYRHSHVDQHVAALHKVLHKPIDPRWR